MPALWDKELFMASEENKARRRALAGERLRTAVEALAGHFGTPVPVPAAHKDPDLGRILEMESLAAFLQLLVPTAKTATAAKKAPRNSRP
jgi:hypothetical protein